MKEQYFQAVEAFLAPFADYQNAPGGLGGTKKPKEFEFIYFATPLIIPVFLAILLHDGQLAVGSIMFVQCYIWFHTKSFILAAMGMAHILFSFPVAFVALRYIFQVRFFSGMCFLSVYIILAIGADDIFVFIDAWRQSFN